MGAAAANGSARLRSTHSADDGGRFADFRDRLAQIAVPTLCIGGAKDPLVPPSRIKREVTQAIPGALSVTLRNAGHNLPVEAPDEIAGAIARFS